MPEKKKVCLLGSTGSVGQNTLEVVRQHPDRFEICSLSCGTSLKLLVEQIQEFHPQSVSVADEKHAEDLKRALKKVSYSPKEIHWGTEGHRHCVEISRPNILMASMSGTFGLLATMEAIQLNAEILGIANKEVLVMAGPFINKLLKNSKTKLIPVDSEHSAIFQALMGNQRQDLKKIILTASGGPFRTTPIEEFSSITKSQALKHPNWVMGAKITIDSATMMNKGLEYIEAMRLFDLQPEQIEIVVHPHSIVHSMVEYKDHSVMAQLGLSDMKIPISLALSYPERFELNLPEQIHFAKIARLDFEEPDFEKFRCLRLAMDSEKMGDHGPVVLNAANEILVRSFLNDEVSFNSIPLGIEEALDSFQSSKVTDLDSVILLDQEVKRWASDWVGQFENKEVGGSAL